MNTYSSVPLQWNLYKRARKCGGCFWCRSRAGRSSVSSTYQYIPRTEATKTGQQAERAPRQLIPPTQILATNTISYAKYFLGFSTWRVVRPTVLVLERPKLTAYCVARADGWLTLRQTELIVARVSHMNTVQQSTLVERRRDRAAA